MHFKNWYLAAFCALSGIMLAPGSVSAAQFVQDGNFAPPLDGNNAPQGWSLNSAVAGITALDPANAVAPIGATSGFWSTDNGGTGTFTTPPSGAGYFYWADPNVYPGWTMTTLTGLTVGQTYTLSFDWAVGEFSGWPQEGYSGPQSITTGWDYYVGAFGTCNYGTAPCPAGNTNDFTGDSSFSTVQTTIDLHSFSGWSTQTDTFVASSTSEVLGFLAYGIGNGDVPPVAILTGVSVTDADTAVPEPASLALILGGLVPMVGVHLRRRKNPAGK